MLHVFHETFFQIQVFVFISASSFSVFLLILFAVSISSHLPAFMKLGHKATG